MTARTSTRASKRITKPIERLKPTIRCTKAQLLDLNKGLEHTKDILTEKIIELEKKNNDLEEIIEKLKLQKNTRNKKQIPVIKPIIKSSHNEKFIVPQINRVQNHPKTVGIVRRGTRNQNSWIATLIASNSRILQIQFEKQLYPGWASDKPFLVFLDAPQNTESFDDIKAFFKNVLIQTHSDKTGDVVCSDQGIIVGCIQELKTDIIKLNKNNVWSLSGKKCLETYTDMINTLQDETVWTDQLLLKMIISAYMDASRRNSGA